MTDLVMLSLYPDSTEEWQKVYKTSVEIDFDEIARWLERRHINLADVVEGNESDAATVCITYSFDTTREQGNSDYSDATNELWVFSLSLPALHQDDLILLQFDIEQLRELPNFEMMNDERYVVEELTSQMGRLISDRFGVAITEPPSDLWWWTFHKPHPSEYFLCL